MHTNPMTHILSNTIASGERNIKLAAMAELSGGVKMTDSPVYALGVEQLMQHDWSLDDIHAYTMKAMGEPVDG